MATGSFAVQIRRFAEKAGRNMDQVVQRTAIDIADRIVEKSPVGNPDLWKSPPPPGYVGGRFRANWRAAESAPDLTVTDEVDPGGNKTKARLAAVIEKIGAGGVTYISNNLPYGPAIENGHSSQSPAGVVEVTAMEFNDAIRIALQELEK